MEFQKKLAQINGIGKPTARCIIAAGYDTPEALAGADLDALKGIPGLSAEEIPALLEEVRGMCASAREDEQSLQELTVDATRLKAEVESLVTNIRDRFNSENATREQLRELRKETTRTLASLERVEAALSDQLRRFGKGLSEADQKIGQSSGLDVEEITVRLRKARKKIDKAVE